MSDGPYKSGAPGYLRNGWQGILPVGRSPMAKWPPITGYTGADGAWPSAADVMSWGDGEEGSRNIGLRLPPHVIGIDVDGYGDKLGADTLDDAEAVWDRLPSTWVTTARWPSGSGIYLYQVPPGLKWPGQVGAGIEIIQYRHRYAMVWPSIHPDGMPYEWITPAGEKADRIPHADELSELSAPWINGLTHGEAEADVLKLELPDVAVTAWLAAAGSGQPCVAVQRAAARALIDLRAGGSRHEAAKSATHRIALLAAEGHRGAEPVLAQIGAAFGTATEHDPDRAGEWARLLSGAVKIAAARGVQPLDPCTFYQGAPLHQPAPPRATSVGAPVPAVPQVNPAVSPVVSPPALALVPREAEQPAVQPATAEAITDPAVALEVAMQRVRRAAKRLLDDEEAAASFRVPPSTLDLSAELALPDEAASFRVEQVLPTGGNVLLTAGFKAGKALCAHEVVQTPSGPVKISELQCGDLVLNPHGGTSVVQGVYPQGERELFDVEFNDGATVRCDAEHLWTVARGQGAQRTLTLHAIMADGVRDVRGRARWHVPIAAPVGYSPHRSLPLDPYLIGALLGDGGLTTGTPHITNADPHVLARVRAVLPPGVWASFADVAGRTGVTVRLTSDGNRTRRNPLTLALEQLGMMGVASRDKRIPQACLRAWAHERYELLCGLMDTDGAVGARGTASITFASEGLADDLAELVRSLGGICRVQRRSTQWPGPDGVLNRGIAWCCTVRFADLCPFSLPRHVERYRPGARRGIRRSIRKVTPAGRGEAVCIKVSASDGLFLTNGFVVTHNTSLVNNLARSLADGVPFLGEFTVTPLGAGERVALWNYEVSRGQYRTWLRDTGIENTDAVAVLNVRGYRMPITSRRVEDFVVAWLIEHAVRVWVIDPFARAFTGNSENDNTEVGHWLDTIDVIKERAGVSELVLPAHTGRSIAEEGAERARGATRLDDWADVRWMLNKNDLDARFFMATGRDVEYPERELSFNDKTRRLAIVGGNRKASRADRTKNAVFAAVSAHPGMGSVELRAAVAELLNGARGGDVDAAAKALLASGHLKMVTLSGNKKGHYPDTPRPFGNPS